MVISPKNYTTIMLIIKRKKMTLLIFGIFMSTRGYVPVSHNSELKDQVLKEIFSCVTYRQVH